MTNAPTKGFSAKPTVAIVGGGICGLGIGWRLAAAGCAVDLFEKGLAGREASWAAAGMLAANVETEPGEEALLALNLESQAAWPNFATELNAVSGVDLGYRDEGTLVVAAHRDDTAELRNTYEFHRSLGLEVEWLTGGQARRMEPHLAPGISAAVSSIKDHQVDNRQLVRALHEAFLHSGGQLHENTAVEAVDVEARQVKGVQVAGRRHNVAVAVAVAARQQLADLKGESTRGGTTGALAGPTTAIWAATPLTFPPPTKMTAPRILRPWINSPRVPLKRESTIWLET